MLLILDPAHGKDTPGKRSPDGKFREYLWSREICSRLRDMINQHIAASASAGAANLKVIFSTESEFEPGLPARVAVANKYPLKPSIKFFLSIHANAAGMGIRWEKARGFSIWTSRGETFSDKYATIIFEQFTKDFPDIQTRTDYTDGDPDIESNFYVLRRTTCPAVLIETMFQDNKEDVKIMQSESFKSKFVLTLFNSILKIVSL